MNRRTFAAVVLIVSSFIAGSGFSESNASYAPASFVRPLPSPGAYDRAFKTFVSVGRTLAEDRQIFKSAVETAAPLSQQGHSPRQLDKILEIVHAKNYQEIRPRSAQLTAAQSFLGEYASTSRGMVTIIGHNESGGFRTIDGSVVDLTQVERNPNALLAVLSCNSVVSAETGQYIGLASTLTYEVALRTQELLEQSLRQRGGTYDQATAQALLDIAFDQASAEAQAVNHGRTVRKVALAGVGGVSVAGYVVYEQVT